MTTEGQQTGYHRRFTEAHVAHDDGATLLVRLVGLQDVLQLLEEPITAHKDGVGGDARDLEEQRLQHDVSRLVGSQTSCRRKDTFIIYSESGVYFTDTSKRCMGGWMEAAQLQPGLNTVLCT